MFEKEAFNEWKAEQYKDQSTEERFEFVEHLHTFPKYFEKTFIDGYNKANEEIKQNGLALQSDMDKTIEQNIALKKELEKANEWHYVKDELPPAKKEYCGRSEPVLVVSKEKEMQYAQYVEKEKTWARGICAIGFEPYAWKEIVLPKEIKENDNTRVIRRNEKAKGKV